MTDHAESTHDNTDTGNELEHVAYDPLEEILGDTGHEVNLTTPLDEEEISGASSLFLNFKSCKLFIRHWSQMCTTGDVIP
jgi:hypothetical protein